jgi:MerT mercuric transport protein
MHLAPMTINQQSHMAGLQRGQMLTAAGGVLGALAAASCCILPLVLFGLGVSGAWIGTFTQLAPYQPFLHRDDDRLPGLRILARLPLIKSRMRRRQSMHAALGKLARSTCAHRGDDRCRRRDRLRFCCASAAQLMIRDDMTMAVDHLKVKPVVNGESR